MYCNLAMGFTSIGSSLSLIRCLIVLSLLPVISSSWSMMKLDEWHCGSEDVSRQISYGQVKQGCPHFADQVNHCCVVHDDCYVRQKGQEYCDKEFDRCHKKILLDPRAKPCDSYFSFSYIMLDLFGLSAYVDSRNHTETEDVIESKLIRLNHSIGLVFDYMYTACPSVRYIISSCAYQLYHCPSSPLGFTQNECADQAMNCLTEAAHYDDNMSILCERALNRTNHYIIHEYAGEGSESISDRGDNKRESNKNNYYFITSNQAIIILMIISLVCAFCLLFIITKYYRLRSFTKEAKYTHIDLSTSCSIPRSMDCSPL